MTMLETTQALATVAVKDLAAAERFYSEILGLKVTNREGSEAINFGSGAASLLVYRSEFAGTNKATAVTWVVGPKLAEIVRDLDAKGVHFEHYDMPGMERNGHIHSAGDSMSVAWFTDPEGNIHSLVSG
jgi:catechol 2,3-dioxygenase-like lactoylglutathione lyase family enzyme